MGKIPDNSGVFILPPKKQKIMMLLAGGMSVEQAAADAGITGRCVRGWMVENDFAQAMREYQGELLRIAQARLAEGQSSALDTLKNVMLDPENTGSVRRQAAVDWLGLLFRYRDAGEVDERLKALEEAIK
jgi:hypothetical protein